MIDIKFNCHDLAGQNEEIFAMHRKMHCLSGMLADIFNDQQPQIKNYEELQKEFTAAKIKNAELTTKILTVHDALDQIIDQYYAAESKISQASEELPIEIVLKKTEEEYETAMPIVTSAINSKELALEDWLVELLYKTEK